MTEGMHLLLIQSASTIAAGAMANNDFDISSTYNRKHIAEVSLEIARDIIEQAHDVTFQDRSPSL
jgi:hypothetical protein